MQSQDDDPLVESNDAQTSLTRDETEMPCYKMPFLSHTQSLQSHKFLCMILRTNGATPQEFYHKGHLTCILP